MYESKLVLVLLLLFGLFLLAAAHGVDHDSDSDAGSGSDSGGKAPDLRAKSLILVKIWCLIIVFFGTFIGGISPYFLKWNEGFLVLGTQFAGGVFLGTAMMHFLSDANETFEDLTEVEYPFAFMLASAGYVITMLVDCLVLSLMNKGRSGGGFHGGAGRNGGECFSIKVWFFIHNFVEFFFRKFVCWTGFFLSVCCLFFSCGFC